MKGAYYNEHDPFAAQWLRNLIAAGIIAPGTVDERSIEDVQPADLVGYTQCHFFAGIGVWSYALRKAGWGDDRPVWTGSCPCQPFSSAGKGLGVDDERHLWPAWFHLIQRAKPAGVPVLGEQVANGDGLTWLDIVQTDLEATGFAFGAVDICAAGVGSPNIRQRIFLYASEGVAQGNAFGAGSQGHPGYEHDGNQPGRIGALEGGPAAETGSVDGVADTERGAAERSGHNMGTEAGGAQDEGDQWQRFRDDAGHGSNAHGLADAGHFEHQRRDPIRRADEEHAGAQGADQGSGGSGQDEAGQRSGDDPAVRSAEYGLAHIGRSGETNGYWAAADWIRCRPEPRFPEGSWRPVEPGTFPLADGSAGHVGRLRAYGNAINAEVARTFIEAVITILPQRAA